ncbi:hypothetical protein L6164_014461 [Bauhinia variegata]|uniref:Uncharacterized protein n=1 Tax=Bauhinia variegata TaxID=167791 RepID=A0ACB9NHY0_BAUVA|nr:hypothetical protein L6164_014461 [Bauhinia variegata]
MIHGLVVKMDSVWDVFVAASDADTNVGMQLQGMALKLGLTKELMVNNSLINMYSKCGCSLEAQVVFDMNDSKNVSCKRWRWRWRRR